MTLALVSPDEAPGPRSARVLLVDDHEPLLRSLARYLQAHGFEVVCADRGEVALQVLEKDAVDLALIDMILPGMSGMDLLSAIKQRHDLPVVMITGFAEAGSAMEAVERGAYEFLTKPLAPELLPVLIENAIDHHRLARQQSEEAEAFAGVVGRSPAMRGVFAAIRDVARTRTPVLLTGETGTGKNLMARETHLHSDRADGPFLHMNCAAITGPLFESELFGHEKGAYTGAETSHAGRFERADGGTLFLDEIDCLPLGLQAKLLRVLEEGEFERVGGGATRRSDARILVATNQDLKSLVTRGSFRQDLFYRLAAFPIRLPSLRERPEDIPPLVRHFLRVHSEQIDRDLPGIDEEAMHQAVAHPWPGNVRELSNAVARAVITEKGPKIYSLLPHRSVRVESDPSLAPAPAGTSLAAAAPGRGDPTLRGIADLPFQEAMAAFHQFYFRRLLSRCRWRKKAATEVAGVDRRTLQRYLKRYEISTPEPSGSSIHTPLPGHVDDRPAPRAALDEDAEDGPDDDEAGEGGDGPGNLV